MSIYKEVMGKDFVRLHPKLQKRYEQLEFTPFQAKGVMKNIQGGPKYLYPFFQLGVRWKLLFPERGEDIPFTITNTPLIGQNGEKQIHWERVFYFKTKKRYFNALMSLDAKRKIIKDYLGEPSLIYSDLVMTAMADGSLQIDSKDQRLVLGKIEIPLPQLFQGLATVNECYLEEEKVFQIKVVVTNPIIGTVFAYEGEFKPYDTSNIFMDS